MGVGVGGIYCMGGLSSPVGDRVELANRNQNNAYSI